MILCDLIGFKLKQSMYRKALVTLLLVLAMFIVHTSLTYAGKLYFEPETIAVAQNQSFSVDIMIDTEGANVGGSTASIQYDTDYLRLEEIEKSVINDSDYYCYDRVFTDYPYPRIDSQNGTVIITGLVSSINNLYIGSGVFCKISFQAVKEGNTTVDFNFTPGDTTDSNIAVTYGNGDVLSSVGSLNVNISSNFVGGTTGTTDTDSSLTTVSTSMPSLPNETSQRKNFVSKMFGFIKEKLGIAEENSTGLDPYAPITSMPSEIRTSANQPEFADTKSSPANFIIGAVVAVLLLVVLRFIIKKVRQRRGPVIRNDIQL